ncbi:MAG TPA: peptide chain release factor N(5)-glutamine methyltransferase [Pirellulaceae bacterium]|nr:peptide chain release factor N(5)-glutamine methyltransferase [Pirellulaceae bacterium]
MSEPWTVLRLLTWTTDYLKAHGSDSPRLDAEVLLAHARGCERIMLYAAFDQVVADDVRAKFRELVKRRAEGAPVAYLVGKREFYSLSLRVTPDVLIPRPETELVVVETIESGSKFKVQGSKLEVADVGTGSGAIAVAVARHAPQCRVTAIDNNPAALAIARENAAANGVAERIEVVLGDLLGGLPAQPRFAVIASNPPYVSESEFATLAPSVKNHEPRQALVAGPEGTEVIERLIPQAAERLLPGGWLIVELSPMIAARVVELIAKSGRYEPATLLKDLAGLQRVVKARRFV